MCEKLNLKEPNEPTIMTKQMSLTLIDSSNLYEVVKSLID